MATDPVSYILNARTYSDVIQRWNDGALTDTPLGLPPAHLRTIDHYRPPRRPYVLEVDRVSNVIYTGSSRNQLRLNNTNKFSIPIRFFRPVTISRTATPQTLSFFVIHSLRSSNHRQYRMRYNKTTYGGVTTGHVCSTAVFGDATWRLDVCQFATNERTDGQFAVFNAGIEVLAGASAIIDLFDSNGNPRLILAYA